MSAYDYEYTLPIPFTGTPDQIFEALTDEAALKTWFSEHAECKPEVGGNYKFWGKYTIDPKTADKATQKITRFEPGKALSYTWHVLGCDSEVTWLMEPNEKEGHSTLTIKQSFDSLPGMTREKELIDDLWRLHTGNLCFYMMGERKIFRPDFDDDSPEVVHEIHINAPRAKVFAALIEPENIKQWFPAPAPIVEPKVGGKYGFGFSFEKDGETITLPPMEILEFEEDRKLTITWPDWRGDKSVPDQQIAWTLEDAEGGTKLTLVHSGFIRTADVSDYPFGWVEFMGAIRRVSEGL